MRFLADESCDYAAVHALRGAGHDVVAVAEVARGAEDSVVIELARSERRVLLALYLLRPYLAVKVAAPSLLALIMKPTNAAVPSAGMSSLSVFSAYTVKI